MNTLIKNLTISSLLYALIQVSPASAATLVNNSENTCLANSVACKSAVAVLNSIDSSTQVSASTNFFDSQLQSKKEIYAENSSVKVHGNCDTQTHKTTTPLSQIVADLSGGDKFGNVLFSIDSSDAKIVSESKDAFDYDMISQSDLSNCHVGEVPIPTAGWLFASALLSFITFSNRRRA